jgi:hypothetical protein
MQDVLLSLGALFSIISLTIYLVSILRGRTKPHRVTRFVLFFVIVLNFISVLAAHGNLGAELYGGILAVYGIVFLLLSLKHGMGGTTLFDLTCLIIAIVGVIGWQVTGNALLGVWLAAAADIVAYTPAFVKTWKQPNSETPWLYTLGNLGAFLSLIAYKISAVSIFQIATILCGVIMVVCIYHKQITTIRLFSASR